MPNNKDPKALAEMISSTKELAKDGGHDLTARLLELAIESLSENTTEIDQRLREKFRPG